MELTPVSESPLVSIVTPSLNQAKTIEPTIQSILNQDYPNIEYIIMDGGSTDGTLEILKKYEGKVKWISAADDGQSDAINKGFLRTKGEIVAWMNSDDYYLPGAISKAVKAFQKEPYASLIFGDGYIINEAADWKVPYGVEPFFDLWKLIHITDFISQPSTFIKRQALLASGLIDPKIFYNLDWELWIRLAQQGKVIYLPEKLSCARVYPEAKTQSGGWGRWREIKDLSLRYGNYKLPPSLILHVPKKHLKNNKGLYPGPVKNAVSLGKWLLYPLTGSLFSGVYQDGYVSQKGNLSLPFISDAKTLILKIESFISGELTIKINNIEKYKFLLNKQSQTLVVQLKEELKQGEFLHLEFRASSFKRIPSVLKYPYMRKIVFCIKDLYYISEQGNHIKNLGFPNFIKDADELLSLRVEEK